MHLKDLILDLDNVRDYAFSLNAVESENPRAEIRDGREYTRHSFTSPIILLERVIKLILALALTVFTVFFALFSNEFRSLWSEIFNGKKPLIIFSTYSPFNKCPREILNIVFQKADLITIGRLARVSTRFNNIQNTRDLWIEIAKDRNIVLDPNNNDIKGQVRDADVFLNLGSVDTLRKIITWNIEGDHLQQKAFFQKALSLFGINHYVHCLSFDSAFFLNKYYYRDVDGLVKVIEGNLNDELPEICHTLSEVTLRLSWRYDDWDWSEMEDC